MNSTELKAWRDRCGFSDREAAGALAMALGTWRNMIYAVTPISARTVRMTELLERAKTGAGSGLSTQGEKE